MACGLIIHDTTGQPTGCRQGRVTAWVALAGVARMRILAYFSTPAEFRAYDPRVTEVARLLREPSEYRTTVTGEHVGSTAVPGCDGKASLI